MLLVVCSLKPSTDQSPELQLTVGCVDDRGNTFFGYDVTRNGMRLKELAEYAATTILRPIKLDEEPDVYRMIGRGLQRAYYQQHMATLALLGPGLPIFRANLRPGASERVTQIGTVPSPGVLQKAITAAQQAGQGSRESSLRYQLRQRHPGGYI